MKTLLSLVGLAIATLGLSQDIRSLPSTTYWASEDPHSLPKLRTMKPAQSLKYNGILIVLSGNNSTLYRFHDGMQELFVTEDKCFDDVRRITLGSFLKLNAGKDIREGVPANSRIELPRDLGKLSSFTGTLVKRQTIGVNQVFVLVNGKIVSATLTNAMDRPYPKVIPVKKH